MKADLRDMGRRQAHAIFTFTGPHTVPARSAFPALALAAMLAALALPAAQLDAQVTLGFRAGATGSTMRITDATGGVREASPKFGGQGAVTLGYSVNDRLGLVVDVGYTQRGAELTLLDGDILYDAIWGYDYVDVSLLGRASLGPAYLLAGPSMAFRTACYTKISQRASCESVDAVFREDDFLILGGAGVTMDLGSTALVAEGLYNLGFRNIDDQGVTTSKHHGLVLRIGADFRPW